MERCSGEPAGEHLASEISPVRGSPDKIEAACGLLSNSEGPGPLLDFKDFIKKAGSGEEEGGAAEVPCSWPRRSQSGQEVSWGGRGGTSDIGNTRKGSQPKSARQAGPNHPGEKRRPGC